MDDLRGQIAIERTSFSAGNQKGQIAIEFFLYAGVFLFILLAAFSMIQLLQTSEVPAQEAKLAQEQGESMAETLRLSVVAGQGFQHNLTFPKKLLGRPYEIAFDDAKEIMVLTWNTSVGVTDYIYTLPGYSYSFEGCLDDNVLISDECSNVLEIQNDGTVLTVRQD